MSEKETTEYVWDGEMVKSITKVKDLKLKPSQILNGLDGVRAQIAQMKDQKDKSEQQIKTLEKNLKQASEDEAKLAVLEDKCVELQIKSLKLAVEMIKDECKKAAIESAAATIAKDPSAYTAEQVTGLPYLDYQKNLATHKKVGEKICNRIISKYLYDEPVFENPFGKPATEAAKEPTTTADSQ